MPTESIPLGVSVLAMVQAVSNRAAEAAHHELQLGNPIKAESALMISSGSIVTHFVAYIASQKCAEYEFRAPMGWREALKERWLPRWALRRWPVRYRTETVKVSECYPKIALPSSCGPSFRIMVAENTEDCGV